MLFFRVIGQLTFSKLTKFAWTSFPQCELTFQVWQKFISVYWNCHLKKKMAQWVYTKATLLGQIHWVISCGNKKGLKSVVWTHQGQWKSLTHWKFDLEMNITSDLSQYIYLLNVSALKKLIFDIEAKSMNSGTKANCVYCTVFSQIPTASFIFNNHQNCPLE